jgi:hypothetical protein
MFRLNKEFDSIDDFPILGSPSPPPALLSGRPKSYAAASSTNQHGYKYAGDLTRKLSKNDFPALSPINNNTNTDSLMGSPWHNGYPTSILEQQQGQSNGEFGYFVIAIRSNLFITLFFTYRPKACSIQE